MQVFTHRGRRLFQVRVGRADKAVTDAFEKIFNQGRTPINLQTDDGKEFYNKTFQSLLTRKGIHHFSTSGDTKASVVERYNRTLKQRMYRYFTVKNTLNFIPGYLLWGRVTIAPITEVLKWLQRK